MYGIFGPSGCVFIYIENFGLGMMGNDSGNLEILK
jgi:hypothetical protein